jgi:hypothetical protein
MTLSNSKLVNSNIVHAIKQNRIMMVIQHNTQHIALNMHICSIINMIVLKHVVINPVIINLQTLHSNNA